MGCIIAGNQILDRGFLTISTNAPITNDVGGTARPVSSLLNRLVNSYWIKPAGSYHLDIVAQNPNASHTLATPPRLRVFGLLMYPYGFPSGAMTFTVQIRASSTVLESYNFVFPNAGDVGDMLDVWLVLPANALAGGYTYRIGLPTMQMSFWRLFASDYVDVSDAYGGWDQAIVDPNTSQSSTPGGSYTRLASTFGQQRRRRERFSLRRLSEAQAFGAHHPDAWGTSVSDILASNGTTGEVLLLPRYEVKTVDGKGRASWITDADWRAIRDQGVLGHFTSATRLGMDDRATDLPIGGPMMLAAPNLELDSLVRIYAP